MKWGLGQVVVGAIVKVVVYKYAITKRRSFNEIL